MSNQPGLLTGALWTPATRLAARNLAWLLGLHAITQACAFATFLLITLALDRQRLGMFTFAMTLQSYLVQFGIVGTKPLVVREAARRPNEIDMIATAHVAITGCASVLVGAATIAAALLAGIPGDEKALIIFVALGNVAASVGILPFFDIHHAQRQSALISVLCEATATVFFFAGYAAGYLTLPLIGFLFAAKWTAISLAHHWVYLASIHRVKLHWQAAEIRRMLQSGWPIMITTLVATAPLGGTVILVRLLHGASETAAVGIAAQVAQMYLMLLNLVGRVLNPHIAGASGLTPPFLRKLLAFYSFAAASLGAAVWLAAWVLAYAAMRDACGDVMAAVTMMLAAAMVMALGNLGATYLIVLHLEKHLMLAWLASSAAFVPLALAFSRLWGPSAMALAAVLSVLIAATALWIRAGAAIHKANLQLPRAEAT